MGTEGLSGASSCVCSVIGKCAQHGGLSFIVVVDAATISGVVSVEINGNRRMKSFGSQ